MEAAVADWTDEDLSAHLDQALAPEAARALEAALREDPGLSARFAALKAANDAARAAFAEDLRAPIPDRLRRLVEDYGEAPRLGAEVVNLDQRRRPAAQRPRTLDWRMAAAASIATLAIGWAAGSAMRPGGIDPHAYLRADATAIEPGNPLFALLETTPAGQSVASPDGDSFHAIASFPAANGQYCREFELASEAASAVGVACRDETLWRMQVLLAAADRASTDQGYAPASGFNAAALEAVLGDLGGGQALGAQEEAAQIARGWRAE